MNRTANDSSIEMRLTGSGKRKNTLLIRAVDDDGIAMMRDSMTINYCPICGRKFDGDEADQE